MFDDEKAKPHIRNEENYSSTECQQVGNVITAGRDVLLGSRVFDHREGARSITLHSDEGKKILNWLSDLKFLQRFNDHLSNHQEGTGTWFLESPQYIHWRDGPPSTLWIKGMPGAGKSTLLAFIADRITSQALPEHCQGLVFFNRELETASFTSNVDRTTYLRRLLGAIIRQIGRRDDCISEAVAVSYREHEANDTRPTEKSMLNLLTTEIKRFKKVCLVVDALDECPTEVRAIFINYILRIQQASTATVQILCSSRDIQIIAEELGDVAVYELVANLSDLEIYIRNKASEVPALRMINRDAKLFQYLLQVLGRKAGGMFLLVKLLLHLLGAKKPRTPNAMRLLLTDISHGTQGLKALDDIYARMWEVINESEDEDTGIAKIVFAWVTFGMRLLTVAELQHALVAQKSNITSIDVEDLFDEASLTENCLGLIVPNNSKTLDYVHPTARDYYLKHLTSVLPDVHADFCKTCWTYLSLDSLDQCTYERNIKLQFQSHIFLSYAISFWSNHAEKAGDHFMRYELVDWMNKSETVGRILRLAVSLFPNYQNWTLQLPDYVEAHHLASYFGLYLSLEALLYAGADPNGKDGLGWTAVRWATWSDHIDLLELLVRHGADVDCKDDEGSTTLHWALNERQDHTPPPWSTVTVEEGIYHVGSECVYTDLDLRPYMSSQLPPRCSQSSILFLIENTKNINLVDSYGETALLKAAQNRQFDIVRLLLEFGADINHKNTMGLTPLMASMQTTPKYKRYPSIIAKGRSRVLIGNRYLSHPLGRYLDLVPTPDVRDAREDEDTISKLIGEDLNVQDDEGLCPVEVAFANDLYAVAEILLQNEAQLDLIRMKGLRLPSPEDFIQNHQGVLFNNITIIDNAEVCITNCIHYDLLEHIDPWLQVSPQWHEFVSRTIRCCEKAGFGLEDFFVASISPDLYYPLRTRHDLSDLDLLTNTKIDRGQEGLQISRFGDGIHKSNIVDKSDGVRQFQRSDSKRFFPNFPKDSSLRSLRGWSLQQPYFYPVIGGDIEMEESTTFLYGDYIIPRDADESDSWPWATSSPAMAMNKCTDEEEHVLRLSSTEKRQNW